MVIQRPGSGRRGASAVEMAIVLIPLTMFIFALFEYCWLLTNWNLLNNAAREGCRYALVNNTSSTIDSDVQTVVTKVMAGADKNFSNFTVSVGGIHQGVSTSTTAGVNALVAGDLITVTVQGQYRFMNIIPFVQMPASVTLSSAVTMDCEGVN